MSTEYTLINNMKGCIDVCEHSNKFDICIQDSKLEPQWCDMVNLTLEDMKNITEKLVNVISYYDPDYTECKVSY